ncbi:hypothetical protein [Halovivax ruber]|nr:hypothetical protein [Halovivax ruber]
MSRDSTDADERRMSADRKTIRGWADEHRAIPIRDDDRSTDEAPRYRVVGESTVGDSHERADWDEFFDHLDEGDQVVVYRGAETDQPFEVIDRTEAITRGDLSEAELEERLIEGEVVTSEVRETTVVESVVVEEATIESELVDTDLVDQEVLDVELVSRECTGCRLVGDGEHEASHRDWFDEGRYVGSLDARMPADGTAASGQTAGGGAGTLDPDHEQATEMDVDETGTSGEGLADDTTPRIDLSDAPYAAEFDVEEMWSVTRGFVERFTIESRVAETDVAGTDTVEGRDIDVEGLHRSIATSELLDVDLSADEVLSQCEIQTEFAEDDRIRTHFDRERVVEDDVVDRKLLQADVTDGTVESMEVTSSRDVSSEITDEAVSGDAGTSTGLTGGESIDADDRESGAGRVTLTDDEVGKTVVDATGEEVGMVAAVEENGEVMQIDAHPGLTDRIKAALEWGDAGEDEYPVEVEQVARVTDDQVQLKGTEKLDGSERAD